MKNTEDLYRQVLEQANQIRIEQYETICDLIHQLTAISIIAHSLIRQLELDPAYKLGHEPLKDLGPAIPFQEDAPALDEDNAPAYTPPPGCANCAYRDFAPDK